MFGFIKAGLQYGTTLSRSAKMIGVGRTAIAAGARVGKTAFRGAKAGGRGLWKGAKVLGAGAAALWALGAGNRNEIQLGNEDSYGNGDGGAGNAGGTGTGTSSSAVVTELPALKTPDQPEKVSSPTIATLIQSVDRLTGVATGIADNLLNLQNILVGQIEQSSDAAREAMLESGRQGMIAPTSDGGGDAAAIEGALEDLGKAVNPPAGLVETIIAGAIGTWGLASTIKGFFTKSAAARAAESRAAAAAASRTTAEAATQTARATRIGGGFTRAARIGGRALAGAGAALSAADSYSAFQRNRPGLGVFNAGAAALSGAELAASLGASTIAIPLAVAGAAAASLAIPFAVGELTSDEVTSRLMALEQSGLNFKVKNQDIDGWLGKNTAAVFDSVNLGGVNVPADRLPQPLRDIIDFYLGLRGAGPQRVNQSREKYAQYLSAVVKAGSLAEVAKAGEIIDPKKGTENSVRDMTGYNKGYGVYDAKKELAPGALEVEVGKYVAGQTGRDPNTITTAEEAKQLSRELNEKQQPSTQKAEKDSPKTTTASALGAERGVDAANVALAPQTYAGKMPEGERARPTVVRKLESFGKNPRQAPVTPIGASSVKPQQFEFEDNRQALGRFTDFMIPPANRMPTFDGQKIDMGQVPDPNFVAMGAYSAQLYHGSS